MTAAFLTNNNRILSPRTVVSATSSTTLPMNETSKIERQRLTAGPDDPRDAFLLPWTAVESAIAFS